MAIPLGAGIGIGLGIQDEVKGWYKVRHRHTLPWHALPPMQSLCPAVHTPIHSVILRRSAMQVRHICHVILTSLKG